VSDLVFLSKKGLYGSKTVTIASYYACRRKALLIVVFWKE
jgi:hypothetical protein